MRVADNGCGIPADELPLAIAPHATSKLAEADDLFRVGTLGFRGEALASIGEVSRLVLRSRTAANQGGAEIEVAGGHAGEVAPCGCPVGTTVEVHNLFYNTPVRRKFMRTPQTEFGHISEAFTRIALAAAAGPFHPAAQRAAGVRPAGQRRAWSERIAALFGRELAERLIFVESRDGDGADQRLRGPSQPEPQQQPHAVPVPQRPAHPRPRLAARPGRGLSRAAHGGPLSRSPFSPSRCRPTWST